MIKRDTYLKKINTGFLTVPIVILIGARQVGKTTMAQNYKFKGATLFLNGQDPEVALLFQKLSTLEAYLKVYLNMSLKGLLIIDEFQFIDGISVMLKILSDKNKELKILCTGSSSLDILQKVNESLAGRTRIVEVLSLSFEESLLFKDQKLYDLYLSFTKNTGSSVLTDQFQDLLNEYLLYGGLPRAALTGNPEEKIEIINDIYRTYLLKDVRSYIKNEHFIGFNKLLRLLSNQIANLVNINFLSRETGIPYKKCEEYISLLEQMYIIKLIEPYHTNKGKAITKMKKIFFCDTGLRNIVYGNMSEMKPRIDGGSVFENYVFLELWRKKKSGENIYFYRTTDGAEVDFIIKKLTGKTAVECKFSKLVNPVSLKALNNFSLSEGIDNKYIVNETLNTVYKNTHHIQGFMVSKMDL